MCQYLLEFQFCLLWKSEWTIPPWRLGTTDKKLWKGNLTAQCKWARSDHIRLFGSFRFKSNMKNRKYHLPPQIWLIFGVDACIDMRHLCTKFQVKTPCHSWDTDTWFQAFFWLLPSATRYKFATEHHSFLNNSWPGWAIKLEMWYLTVMGVGSSKIMSKMLYLK